MKKKINKNNAEKFNYYATYMAELAYQLLNGKTDVINKKWLKN